MGTERMTRTLEFYDRNADTVAAAYERIDAAGFVTAFAATLGPGARVLEIGCGPGRDAAALCRLGLDVRAVDGSRSMLREAERLHPELRGRTHLVILPARLPFADGLFSAVAAWAVIMHLERDELPAVYSEIARVTAPGARFAYSVNTERVGLDADGYEANGRHFTCLSATEWEALHREAGFETVGLQETDDMAGRPGIRWATFDTVRER